MLNISNKKDKLRLNDFKLRLPNFNKKDKLRLIDYNKKGKLRLTDFNMRDLIK